MLNLFQHLYFNQRIPKQVRNDELQNTLMENERLHRGFLSDDLVLNKSLPQNFAGNIG